jgi:hypothetical protein
MASVFCVTINEGEQKMKKKWVGLFIGLMFLGVVRGVAADEETFSTGKDWVENMSVREKYMSLLPPTLLFEEYDVQLRHSLPEYIYQIDRILSRNPQLENEDVSNIFASTVYLFEPQNRQALRAMELSFLSGNFEIKPHRSVRLMIEEILEGVPG